jgi:hypothetical protein
MRVEARLRNSDRANCPAIAFQPLALKHTATLAEILAQLRKMALMERTATGDRKLQKGSHSVPLATCFGLRSAINSEINHP